jgi:hypothetical protein
MTPLLLVVARSEPERYDYLRRAFAREAAVEVVFDRREGERRQIRESPGVERRRRDRRSRDIAYELDRLGYALVRR